MTELNLSNSREPRTMLPKAIIIPIAILLTLFFVVVGFPWDSLARRIEWEIAAVSGGRVTIDQIAPALTARGPVLRARDVLIEHPAVDRVRVTELEIAPRLSIGWFSGSPVLRIWADSELGLIDGVLGLGPEPSFLGEVGSVELARLPLRLDATGLTLTGQLDGHADISLDPMGTLRGRMKFLSTSLVVQSNLLPIASSFSRAEGVIVILEDGATQIESVSLEGDVLEGRISGDIGLVHRSESPPINLRANLRIIDPRLRQLAPSAGLSVSPNGDIDIRISGTIDSPLVESTASGQRR